MAQGPRHLADSFVATGLRKTAQTLTAAEKAQVLTNIGALPVGTQENLVLTTPTIDGVQYSALNDRQIVTVVVPVVGTGDPAAFALLQLPADAIILRVLLDVTTVATGGSSVDIGYTAATATTGSNTFFEDLDVNAAVGLHDSMNYALSSGLNAHAQRAAAGKWITLEPTNDISGLVATVYIQYILA